jgi:histidine ammonia-lyase
MMSSHLVDRTDGNTAVVAFTRLRPFLADAEPASSGVMILEYAAGAALGELRACSAPASLGHAVLSRGVEEQAGFASPAARQTLRAGAAYRLVVGCELVAAVRALRRRGLRPDAALPVGRAFELAAAVLDDAPADRPLTDDVSAAAAAALLDRFADLTSCPVSGPVYGRTAGVTDGPVHDPTRGST